MMKEHYKFYELYTEYGTLFIYEKYIGEKSTLPETREFFTNDLAQIGYDQLGFNNGQSIFKTRRKKTVKDMYERNI